MKKKPEQRVEARPLDAWAAMNVLGEYRVYRFKGDAVRDDFGGVVFHLVEEDPLTKARERVVRAATDVVEGFAGRRLGRPGRYARLKSAVSALQKAKGAKR